jgi:phosphopantothenoylcysteine synthetase/decarboxylase
VAKVLVGVTGDIAAYKAPGVIRRLREAGHEVRVTATRAALSSGTLSAPNMGE